MDTHCSPIVRLSQSKIEIDEEKIEAKVAAEKQKERERPDALQYTK